MRIGKIKMKIRNWNVKSMHNIGDIRKKVALIRINKGSKLNEFVCVCVCEHKFSLYGD